MVSTINITILVQKYVKRAGLRTQPCGAPVLIVFGLINDASKSCVLQVSDVPLPPPRQSATPPVRQEMSSSKGFELLLNMLNKSAGPKIKETVGLKAISYDLMFFLKFIL